MFLVVNFTDTYLSGEHGDVVVDHRTQNGEVLGLITGGTVLCHLARHIYMYSPVPVNTQEAVASSRHD